MPSGHLHHAPAADRGDGGPAISRSATMSDGRTATSIRALDREAMVDELARLLGGAEITETVRQNAEEMKKS